MAYPKTFVGTNGTELSAHDATWVQHPSYAGVQKVYNNRGMNIGPGDTASRYYNSEAPSSADYTVAGNFYIADVSSNFFVFARVNASANTMYEVYYSWAELWLRKVVAGTVTQLGSTTSLSGVTNGSTHTLALSCVGSTISALWNGSTIISVTDTAISAAGFGGFGYSSYQDYAGANSIDVQGAGGTATIQPPSIASTLTVGAPTITTNGAVTIAPTSIVSTMTVGTPTVSVTTPSAGFVTLELRNNTGQLLANETGVTVNVYNATTGALVVQKTGLTSSAGGLVTVQDAAMTAGQSYAYEPILSGGRRKLRVVQAS